MKRSLIQRVAFKKPTYEEWLAKKQAQQSIKPQTKSPQAAILSTEKQVKKPSAAKIASQKLSKQEKNQQVKLEKRFREEVLLRDHCRCQFPGCTVALNPFPEPLEAQVIDVHHIATRARRKDLVLVVNNGICLCNINTSTNHHGWVHAHPIQAVEMKLLSDRSRELAEKEGTLGIY